MLNSGPSRKRKSRAPVRAVLLDHVGAGDVGRHQVGRELDAAEGEVQRPAERADHQRLGQARHAFQQAVAAAEQRDQQFLDHLGLADDDLGQLVDDLLPGGAESFDGGGVVRGSDSWSLMGGPCWLSVVTMCHGYGVATRRSRRIVGHASPRCGAPDAALSVGSSVGKWAGRPWGVAGWSG